MSAMETTFTVRTDTDNDAMQVPDGIETVVVNDSAERVIVPPGVQIIRLQTPQGGGGGGGHTHTHTHTRTRSRSRSRSRSPSPDKYGDMIDELVRAKRSAAAEAASRGPRRPAMAEKSLSLPSCPPTPPGSRSAGTDAPDFRAAARPPPLAEHEADIFDDRTLEVDKKRVISQQPTAAPAPAHTAVGNGKLVRYAGETEGEMRDPLVARGSTTMRKLDSFGWREEFERGEQEQKKPAIEKMGRAAADIMCCWLGV